MQIARVKGTVVSTNKSEKLLGLKLMIVRAIDLDTFEEKGAPLVSTDAVGAGVGEVVMIVGGSSSRLTVLTDAKPVDNSIIAIIDSINIEGLRIFDKHEEENKKSPAMKTAAIQKTVEQEPAKQQTVQKAYEKADPKKPESLVDIKRVVEAGGKTERNI